MNHNILKSSDITKIYLSYIDRGKRFKFAVKLRFMDRRECYFVLKSRPMDFVVPKNKIPAQLKVYTPDGVYSSDIKLTGTTESVNEIMFEITIPQDWTFKQLRLSSRKEQNLPIKIKYNDGFEINATTFDISVGGISLIYKETFPSIYEKIPCILTLTLPKSMIIEFPDGKLLTEGYFTRKTVYQNEYGIEEGSLLAYRFVSLKPQEQESLKNYLMTLD